MEEAKKARTAAKATFTRAEGSLLDALKVPKLPQATLKRRFEDFKIKWDNCQNAHDIYSQYTGEMDGGEADALVGWIEELTKRFNSIEIETDLKLEQYQPVAPLPTSDSNVNAPRSNVPKPLSAIKIERLKFPTFKGDIRRYPQFKVEFIKHVAPQCMDDQLGFVLKSYLISEIRDEVDNCGEDYLKIWDRLDFRYGNIQKLIDTILNDIKSMSCEKEDAVSIIAMIDTIEKAHQDLVRLEAEGEMCNSTIISEIERRMPLKMKEEWATLVTKKPLNTSQRFVALMELLSAWRRKLEYMNDDIRSRSSVVQGDVFHMRDGNTQAKPQTKKSISPRCWLHESQGQPGEHPIWKCRQFYFLPYETKIKLANENKVCLICLMTSCPGVDPQNKCQDPKFKCTEPGCEGKHHYRLHKADNKEGNCSHTGDASGQTLLLTQQA